MWAIWESDFWELIEVMTDLLNAISSASSFAEFAYELANFFRTVLKGKFDINKLKEWLKKFIKKSKNRRGHMPSKSPGVSQVLRGIGKPEAPIPGASRGNGLVGPAIV